MANIINIKNGLTKTLTVKKDSTINFLEIDNINNLTFTKSKKNLIISDTINNTKLTVKNYFTNADNGWDYSTSKLTSLTFKGKNEVLLSSDAVKNKADYGKEIYNYSKKWAVYGTPFADTINLNDLDYINCLAGSGNDTITANKTESDYISTGEGNNTITYDWKNIKNTSHYLELGNGSNTIIINTTGIYDDSNYIKSYKDGTVRLQDFKGNYFYLVGYLKNGWHKDIKIQVNTTTNAQHNGATGNNGSPKTVDLQYYFNRSLNYSLNINFPFAFGNILARKKQKLVGNFLNNQFHCSRYGDSIYCIDGENFIYTGRGNDKIYCGLGADTIKEWMGHNEGGIGKDTIYNATSKTRLELLNAYNVHATAFKYTKSGNNLVIQYNNPRLKNKLEQVAIADYFKPDKNKNINSKDRLRYIYDANAYQRDDGIWIYDLDNLNKRDLQVMEITANISKKSETMYLGKGKFKVNVNKGSAKLVIDTTTTANIAFKNNQSFDENNIIKNGDDLTLNYLVGTKKKGTITIANFFKTTDDKASTVNYNNLTYSLNSNDLIKLQNLVTEDKTIKVTGYSKQENGYNYFFGMGGNYKNNIVGSKKNDRIYAYNTTTNIIDSGAGNDIIHTESGNNKTTIYYSKGYDNCITGSNNDTYNIGATSKKNVGFTKSSKIHIRDTGGVDTMNIISKTKDLRLLFNVDENGNIVTSGEFHFSKNDDKIWDSIMIFNKSSLTAKNINKNNFTGVIEIDNWFSAGKIETINTKNNTNLNMETWINSVKSSVQSWLTTGKYANKYDNALEVFESKDSKAIASLVSVYSKVQYK